MRNLCSETECGSFSFNSIVMKQNTFAERVNIAANALIAQQAAAARLLLASQSLAKCREENNPFIPGNNPFGAPRNLMFMPDPCETQEKELAGATTEHMEAVALAQRSAAPTAQDLQAAPAPQLSSTFDPPNIDPAIPESEHVIPAPDLENLWSPDTLQEIMDLLAMELETSHPGSLNEPEIMDQLEIIWIQCTNFLHWLPGYYPKTRKPIKYQPKNADWIGRWLPG
ncbi:nonstructural protein 2 [Galliform chaphamaparvovirus 12]|nr:nonstructural protein 2 [Galliform chaphamaparvovirus 12]